MTAALALALGSAGCATIESLVRLSQVRFALDDVEDAWLAGVDLDAVRERRRIEADEVLRVASAIRTGRVPLELTVLVGAENPSDNQVEVERVLLDWTLFLQGRETVKGVVDRELVIPPGAASQLPVPVELDLYRFFREDARGLIELARGLVEGDRSGLELRVRPTVYTPLGPIRSPEEIVLTG